MKFVQILFVWLLLFSSTPMAYGHWELVGTPKADGGVAFDHSANGTGLFATAKVAADGNQVTGSGSGLGHIWHPMQASTSRGGKFFEAFTWVGDGLGFAKVSGKVGINATGDASCGGAGRVYGYTEFKSSLTAALKVTARLSVSTGGAGELGTISAGGVSLPIVPPGSQDFDHQTYNAPSDNTEGEDCVMFFWHQRRTYAYVEVLCKGTMINNGTCALNLNGTASSEPFLGGPCQGGGETQVPTCEQSCVSVESVPVNVIVYLMATLFF